MWRLIIIITLAPFLIGGALAHLLGIRVWTANADLSESVDNILNRTLARLNRNDIKLIYGKASPWMSHSNGTIRLPKKYMDSKKSSHVARAMIQLGVHLLHEKHAATVEWRLKTIKVGYVLPAFALLIVTFSFVIGKLPAMIVMATLIGTLGFCSFLLWLSLGVEKEVAHLMVSRIEKLRLMPRLCDEESLVSSILAAPWVSLIPGALLKFIVRD